MRAGFFAIAIETWKRRLKTSSRSSRAFCPSSASLRSRSFVFPFIARLAYRSPAVGSRVLALDHLRPDRELLPRQPKRLARDVLGQPLHLVQDPARLHDRDPVLGVTLALSHARLGRLLGERLVREHPDPDLAPPLDRAGQRHAAGLELAVR